METGTVNDDIEAQCLFTLYMCNESKTFSVLHFVTLILLRTTVPELLYFFFLACLDGLMSGQLSCRQYESERGLGGEGLLSYSYCPLHQNLWQ